MSIAEALKDFSPQQLSHPTKSRPMANRSNLVCFSSFLGFLFFLILPAPQLKILQERVGNNEQKLDTLASSISSLRNRLEENKENQSKNTNSSNSPKANRYDVLMKELAKPSSHQLPHRINTPSSSSVGREKENEFERERELERERQSGVTHEVLEQRLRSVDHSLRSDLLCEMGRVEADLYNCLQQDLYHLDVRISSAFQCISTLGAQKDRERERERGRGEVKAGDRERGREREREREREGRERERGGNGTIPAKTHDLFSTPLAQQQYQQKQPRHHNPQYPQQQHQQNHSPHHPQPPSQSPSSVQFEGLSLDAFLSLSNDSLLAEHFQPKGIPPPQSTPPEQFSSSP